MQSMQRQFGKLWNKGPGDNAKVSILLSEYEDADKILAKIIDNARLWRDSWASLVSGQLQIVTEFEGLYDPIVGASDGHGRPAVPTPQLQLERTFRLKVVFAELKTELVEEISTIDQRIIKPATDARDCIAPIRKTIKKREAKRVDYEKIQEKVIKLQRKPGRTQKEDISLAKMESEMARAADEFGIADDHLRTTLPPIIASSFQLIPPLLSVVVLIQNRLLGLYYTSLHSYCEENNFPSPPPPMEDVIAAWNAAFRPVQSEIESISFIARGKTAQQAMTIGKPSPQPQQQAPTGLITSTNRMLRAPSSTMVKSPPTPAPEPSTAPAVKRPEWANPTDFTTATILGGAHVDKTKGPSPSPSASASSLAAPRPDYFSRPSTASSTGSSIVNANGNGFVKKKPPPPPPKRAGLGKPEEFVIAMYPFQGQGAGDLSFGEGDRIKVVKKTGTDQDWWVGELGGVQGSFPANYCKPL